MNIKYYVKGCMSYVRKIDVIKKEKQDFFYKSIKKNNNFPLLLWFIYYQTITKFLYS